MCSRPSFNDQMPHCQRGMKPLVSNTSRIAGISSSCRKAAVRRHRRGESPWGLLPRFYPRAPGGRELAGVGPSSPQPSSPNPPPPFRGEEGEVSLFLSYGLQVVEGKEIKRAFGLA